MSNPLIRDCENFVVLEPLKEEKVLSASETLKWLETWLQTMDELPSDLQKESSIQTAAKRLLDTACSLEITRGFTLQWFAIRLDPPEL